MVMVSVRRSRWMRSVPRAARVPAAHDAEVIAEMRLEAARPFTLPRDLPLRGFLNLRRGEVVERDVLPVAARAAEAARAEDAGDGGERGDVLLVVPLVELGVELGRDVHRVQQ